MLRDGRAGHIRTVLKAGPGRQIKTGTVNGLCGRSTVLDVSDAGVLLEVHHDEESIKPWFDLLLAMPRPLVLKRLWPQLTALGAGRIVLVNAAKVEKFYFSSQWIALDSVRPLLLEGAVQAGVTHLPDFSICMNLTDFMRDELDAAFDGSERLLAHPAPDAVLPECRSVSARPLLAIGPEGGWTEDEIALFMSKGFAVFSLGPRILRSDTACIALISVLGHSVRGGGAGGGG
jgi:16S rRNA (uracil1498-N3)-methyltransferase